MEWTQLIGFCLFAAVIVVVIRPINPTFSGLLCVAFGVMLVSVLLPEIRHFIECIHQFLTDVGLEGTYYIVMFKAVGIVFMTELAEQICRDMGVQAIAERVEFCGRLAMLGVAVPLFIDLTKMTIGVLR